MIILGAVLIALGYLTGISLLITVGVVLIVIGAALYILGAAGHPVGGRRGWF